MWLWVFLSALTISNVARASPETIDRDFLPENDEDLYLYSNERTYDESPRESRDIEARRRSALDKNFMRFGRSYNSFPQKNYDDEINDIDEQTFSRNIRKNNDNFMRFGRGGDFMRFGREPYMNRNSRGQDKNFIRFGRSVPLKRNRRSIDPNENMEEFKRGTNRDMLRFGRANNRDMLRFGRANNRDMLRFGRRDNFLRFGRRFNENEFNQISTNQSSLNDRNEKLSPIYNSLLDLLTEFALQNLRHNEEKDISQRVR